MKILLPILFIFILVACKTGTDKNTNNKPPNFIVFIADDAAWNDCGPYGNTVIKTPNLKTP